MLRGRVSVPPVDVVLQFVGPVADSTIPVDPADALIDVGAENV